ncbi:hypothetical protein ACJJIW_20165 [Microbulbifer sp. JMSA004]|nr:hypothetical protein [Microbulbifer sp. VAAF005]WHI46615.1 hypothetical protein P0078_23395 [Microbulbifer sp. VAAF005]
MTVLGNIAKNPMHKGYEEAEGRDLSDIKLITRTDLGSVPHCVK